MIFSWIHLKNLILSRCKYFIECILFLSNRSYCRTNAAFGNPTAVMTIDPQNVDHILRGIYYIIFFIVFGYQLIFFLCRQL